MNPFNNRFGGKEVGERNPVNVEAAELKLLNFHLKIADHHVDTLNGIPEFRDLSIEQLLKRLPRRYRQFIPPIGDDLGIREAAFQRETRMARAVIIGMLAAPSQIEQATTQKFLECL